MREAVWARFYTAAPRPRTRSEQRYSDRRLRSKSSPPSPDGTDIEVAAYEDRGNVVISIEDEGKGIPTEELESVFDKFRRLEQPSDRGKGIGLGLSISKGFVEALGGRIAAASPIHGDAACGFRGTRVLISLRKQVPTHHELL